jgi:DNA-binding transcriptional LysR family regulator
MLRMQIIMTNRRVDLVEEGEDIAVRVCERRDGDADLQLRRIGSSKRF